MAKKKSKAGTRRKATTETPKDVDVVQLWNDYFGLGDLEDWQRLCRDLGLAGDLGSKNKCRKAMKGVWINIYDFLAAPNKAEVERFPSQAALARYTIGTGKVYPRRKVARASPLKLLLAHVLTFRR